MVNECNAQFLLSNNDLHINAFFLIEFNNLYVLNIYFSIQFKIISPFYFKNLTKVNEVKYFICLANDDMFHSTFAQTIRY